MYIELKDIIPGWNDVRSLTTLGELAATVPEDGWIFEIGSYCGRASYVLGSNKRPSVTLTCSDNFPDAPQVVPKGINGDEGTHYNHFTFMRTVENIPNVEVLWGKAPMIPRFATFSKSIDVLYFNEPYDPERTLLQLRTIEAAGLIQQNTVVALNMKDEIKDIIDVLCPSTDYKTELKYGILFATKI